MGHLSVCLPLHHNVKSILSHANADGQSRLPLNDNFTIGLSREASIFNISQIDCLLVIASQEKQATSNDPLLCTVVGYTKNDGQTLSLAR